MNTLLSEKRLPLHEPFPSPHEYTVASMPTMKLSSAVTTVKSFISNTSSSLIPPSLEDVICNFWLCSDPLKTENLNKRHSKEDVGNAKLMRVSSYQMDEVTIKKAPPKLVLDDGLRTGCRWWTTCRCFSQRVLEGTPNSECELSCSALRSCQCTKRIHHTSEPRK